MTLTLIVLLIGTNTLWAIAYRSLSKRHVQIVTALLEKILGATE